jgi:hypothetical protein
MAATVKSRKKFWSSVFSMYFTLFNFALAVAGRRDMARRRERVKKNFGFG